MAYTTILAFSGLNGVSNFNLPSSFTIPVEAVNFGFTNSTTIGSGSGGGGAGKFTFDNFTLTRYVDDFSPYFLTLAGSGAHYNTATLTLTQPGVSTPVAVYTLSTVFCTNVTVTGNQHGGPIPTEAVTLVFGALRIQYTNPTTGATTTGSWSQITNQP